MNESNNYSIVNDDSILKSTPMFIYGITERI